MATGAAIPVPLTWSHTYQGRPDQVARTRRVLAGLLDGRPVASDAILCLSELATNAVTHSNSRKPGGRFTVRVAICRGGRLRVEVEDQGGPWPRPAHQDGQHGRGLLIVSKLARDWGISGDSQAGRTVWFEIDCS